MALAGGCTSPAASSEHVHDHHVTAAGGPVAPTAVPTTAELRSSCAVQPPTSEDGQLESVELVVAGDQLVLVFALTRPVSDDLTVKVVATSDATGVGAGAGFGITAAVHGTEPTAMALQTPTSTTAAERPEDYVHVEGDQVHIGVPSSLVEQLGRRWHWSASSATATTHAMCPVASSATPATVAVP